MSGPHPTASIDELLRYEDDPRPSRRVDTRLAWTGKVLAQAVGLSALAMLAAYPFRIGLPVLLVFPAALALVLLRRVLRRVDVFMADRPVLRPPGNTIPVQDGLFAAATRWDTRLSWTQSDPARFTSSVQVSIVELANERLRQRHNCTITDDPARARELLGGPLWTFLTAPVTRSPTPHELAVVVAKLEAL